MNPLMKLVNWYWNLRYPELSQAQVEKAFDCFEDIEQFSTFLKAAGFKWSSDGLNYTQLTDTFERPGQVLSRKFANCGGYMRLFKEFCKHRKCFISLVEYELTDGPLKNRWHYVSLIETDQGIFSQSNMDILKFDDYAKFDDFWATKYKKMRIINVHKNVDRIF